MVENKNRPLKDFSVPSEDEAHSSIINHAIQTNKLDLKPSILEIVQQNKFFGNPMEDLNLHLFVFV